VLDAEFDSASNGMTFREGRRAIRGGGVWAEIPVKSGFYLVNPADIRMWTCVMSLVGCVGCRI
jgi:hypothetical protein